MTDEIFESRSAPGITLRGILTIPKRVTGAPVLLLPAGLKYRVGPGRLYVSLARWFAERGHPVLRFDPQGMGESDGTLESGRTLDLWDTIENGRFVADGIQAGHALLERFSAPRFHIGGLCGGAITAQLVANLLPEKIAGVISINTAATFSIGKTVGTVEARQNLREYTKKWNSPESWKRMLGGESSYETVWASLVGGVRSLTGSMDCAAERKQLGLNPLFTSSLTRLLEHGVSQLFLFSENDSRWPQFQEMVLAHELNGLMEGPCHTIKVIPNANHELHLREWRQSAFAEIAAWLDKHPTAVI